MLNSSGTFDSCSGLSLIDSVCMRNHVALPQTVLDIRYSIKIKIMIPENELRSRGRSGLLVPALC